MEILQILTLSMNQVDIPLVSEDPLKQVEAAAHSTGGPSHHTAAHIQVIECLDLQHKGGH